MLRGSSWNLEMLTLTVDVIFLSIPWDGAGEGAEGTQEGEIPPSPSGEGDELAFQDSSPTSSHLVSGSILRMHFMRKKSLGDKAGYK